MAVWATFNKTEVRYVLALLGVIGFGAGVELVRQTSSKSEVFQAAPPSAAPKTAVPGVQGLFGSAPVTAPSPTGPPSTQIDINTASADVLEALPGIGPSLAAAIVSDRAANGPFRSVSDLDRVKGIGPALSAKLAPYLSPGSSPIATGASGQSLRPREDAPPPAFAAPPTAQAFPPAPAGSTAASVSLRGPVNINSATQEQLETLDGIGPTKAQAILEYRRRHGGFASPDRIMDVKGIGKKTYEANQHRITVR